MKRRIGARSKDSFVHQIEDRRARRDHASRPDHGVTPDPRPFIDAGVSAEQHAVFDDHGLLTDRLEDPADLRPGGDVNAAADLTALRTLDGPQAVQYVNSRLYLLRDGALQQVTSDHTWVQREIDAGRLSPSAARSHPLSHIVTRVLSEDIDPEIDLTTLAVAPGDILLLCTDGLHNMLDDAAIVSNMAAGAIPLPEATTRLVSAANAAGGADNITVLLIRILTG